MDVSFRGGSFADAPIWKPGSKKKRKTGVELNCALPPADIKFSLSKKKNGGRKKKTAFLISEQVGGNRMWVR